MRVKKGREFGVEGSRERGRQNKNWVDVFREDMKECEVNREMVRDKLRAKVRVAEASTCVG